MTDIKLFNEVFGKYKTSYMAELLGISETSYINKKSGMTPFKQSEISILKKHFNLTPKKLTEIFFT